MKLEVIGFGRPRQDRSGRTLPTWLRGRTAKEPESLLPALVRRLVLASGVQPLWIYRRGLWLRWVPFSIVRRTNRRRLSGTPQAYRGDLDPGEQRDDEQIVGYARQQEQQYR
jgi:hypothetical protein